MFFCKFLEIFKNTFLTEHLGATASISFAGNQNTTDWIEIKYTS